MRNEADRRAKTARRLRRLFPAGESAPFFAALEETAEDIERTDGRTSARRWLRAQIFRSLPGLLKNSIDWRLHMMANDFKVAWRDIRKHKANSFITIGGLAVGAAACLLISLYVGHELNFDDYHRDGDRIFRLLVASEFSQGKPMASVSELAAPTLRRDFPEVEYAARVQSEFRPPLFQSATTILREEQVFYADQEIFDILTIPFFRGRPDGVLDRPGTMVLTESMAVKYFGRDDPIGKSLLVNGVLTEVTGIIRDCPSNTHFQCRAILSYKTFEPTLESPSWQRYDPRTYLKVRPGTDIQAFAAKIARLSEPYLRKENPSAGREDYSLQPVRSIHLDVETAGYRETPGHPGTLLLLSGLALIIMILAGLNFVNLTTARSAGRAKEVGVRKTIGAERPRLIRQFLGESVLVAFAAFAAGLFLAGTMIGLFNRFAGTSFVFADLVRPGMILSGIGLLLATGLAAGLYPAFFLSSFRPAAVLRRDSSVRLKGGRLRRVLVVGQFAVAVLLITMTLAMNRQIRFMKTKPLGFDKDQKLVVVFPGGAGSLPSAISGGRQAAIKQEFARHPGVRSAALSSSAPSRGFFYNGARLVGGNDKTWKTLRYLIADADFLADYKIEIIAGRPISESREGREILLNQTALGLCDWRSPREALGRRLTMDGKNEMEIVGVVRDFHLEGLQAAINPLAIGRGRDRYHMATLTFDPSRLKDVLAFIGRTWTAMVPGQPLDYFFLDESIARQYQKEERTASLFMVFAGLAVGIACLGLFGLASFLAEKRTKEIGVRKVLGASVADILGLLSREFAVGILIAAFLAWPVAFLAVQQWLKNFAYRRGPGVVTFLLSGALALAVAMVSVGGRAMRAALADPVHSLRCE